ncbi:DUF2844 domain-containing protein [Caenimonas terrae]|uniref:DUF2844 domain-containing protein n=1 Tax=Caenimonas terrae TaxID=696074 RepID=A0ABW0NHG7_9BURK
MKNPAPAGRRRVLPLLLALLVLAPLSSRASLGGTSDTVQADQASMRATRRVANRTGYAVHEMVLASGTVVREFASPSGVVFGVAWQGPVKPDLSQLLGVHFDRLAAAGQRPHGGHRALRVQEPDLVIESGGRMRAFSGRAYLPDQLPAGVTAGEIQ